MIYQLNKTPVNELLMKLDHNNINEYIPITYDFNKGILDKCPEDVFFTRVMIDFNLGKVADHETAKLFSIESINCENSLGGHCFWLCDPNWKKRLHKTVIQFQLNLAHT